MNLAEQKAIVGQGPGVIRIAREDMWNLLCEIELLRERVTGCEMRERMLKYNLSLLLDATPERNESMNEPVLAGTFSAVPVRIHAYRNGTLMFVDENHQGCWSDPNGRMLVSSLEVADRILAAHGYARQDMSIVAGPAKAAEAPTPPAVESEPEKLPEVIPEPEPRDPTPPLPADPATVRADFPPEPPLAVEPKPEPEPVKPAPQKKVKPTTKRRR